MFVQCPVCPEGVKAESRTPSTHGQNDRKKGKSEKMPGGVALSAQKLGSPKNEPAALTRPPMQIFSK